MKIEKDKIIACFPEKIVINGLLAKQMTDEILAFQKGCEYPVIFYLNGVKHITREACRYFKKYELNGIKSAAFITTTPVEDMVLRFLFHFEPIAVPSKIFSVKNEKEAFKWLNQFAN